MPELPEVETVRRGLEPAMEGARFEKVEVRDRRLRWPIAKGFEKRIEGTKVEGLGRRATEWKTSSTSPCFSSRGTVRSPKWVSPGVVAMVRFRPIILCWQDHSAGATTALSIRFLSFRGAASGREPGIHSPGAAEYGFRVRSP